MYKARSVLDLSIVIPTHNAGALAERSSHALDRFFRERGISFEIILVDDGSSAGERPEQTRIPPTAALLQLPENRGKGYAVRSGFLAAKGRCRVFTDVDLPYGADALLRCYDRLCAAD